MTERKPAGSNFESWVERQIREATERGVFDGLPGAGKPIPGVDNARDELWWVRDKLRRENVSYVPPSLALRKEAEDVRERAMRARTESEVRDLIGDLNERIRDAIRKPLPGPPLALMPLDVEQVVEDWREGRGAA